MASLFQFGGISTRRPVVRARIDDIGLIPLSLGQLQIVALLGTARGGEPKVPILISAPNQGVPIFRGGDIVTALPRVFAPSASLNDSTGASLVYCVRVNPATRAALTLKDVVAADSVVLTAVNWGIEDNQIKVQVETGTNAGKKVSVALGSTVYFKDDIYREAFSIDFTGQSAAPTLPGAILSNGAGTLAGDYYYKIVSVDQFGHLSLASPELHVNLTGLNDTAELSWTSVPAATSYRVYRGTVTDGQDHYQVATTNAFTDLGAVGIVGTIPVPASAAHMSLTGTTLTTTIVDGIGGQNLSVVLADYPNIQALVDFLNAQYGYTAVVLTTNPGEITKNGLDLVTAANILSTVVKVTSTLEAIVDWFNSNDQPLVTAVRAVGAGAPPQNIGYIFLGGGTEGVAVNQDWQDAFDALQKVDAAYIVPLSSDAAIHNKARTHILTVSASGFRPRRAIVGAALGEKTSSLSAYISRAAALNSDRMLLIAQGVKDFNDADELVTLDPYFTAAQMAGMQAGLQEIGEPLTHKAVGIVGLEWEPTEADQELMIVKGILPIERAPQGGFRIVRGITTWLINDAFHRVEFSVGVEMDEVVRRVVVTLDQKFLGHKATADIAFRVASEVETILLSLMRDGIIVAYRSITVTVQGDIIYVDFECAPTLPINFIGVTIHAVIATSTITIAVR